MLNFDKLPSDPIRPPFSNLGQLPFAPFRLTPNIPELFPMRHKQETPSLRPHPAAKVFPPLMPLGRAAQPPCYIVAQKPTRGRILEAEPAFYFGAFPVDMAIMSARQGQQNLSVEQRDHATARDRADDEGGAGIRDQRLARFGAAGQLIAILIGGFGRSGGCVDSGVVVVRDGFRVDLVEDHDIGVLDCRDRDIALGSDNRHFSVGTRVSLPQQTLMENQDY